MSVDHKQFERDQVVKIVQTVVAKMGETDKTKDVLTGKLLELAGAIERTRKDISQSGAGTINLRHIPNATDELDAVVEATKGATMTIMEACEKIQSISTDSNVNDEVTRIFEACTFQDITGQRITKVIRLLKDIEVRVESLLDILGHKPDDLVNPDEDTRMGDAKLLNGPQLADQAMSQDEIDKLLNSF